MLILGVALGLILGLAVGGRIENLIYVRLRWIGLLFLAAAIRFGTEFLLVQRAPDALPDRRRRPDTTTGQPTPDATTRPTTAAGAPTLMAATAATADVPAATTLGLADAIALAGPEALELDYPRETGVTPA